MTSHSPSVPTPDEIELAYSSRLLAFAARTPEYQSVMEALAGTVHDVPLLPRVNKYIKASANGPEIGFHFAQHPTELERLQSLPVKKMMQELWRLDSQISEFKIKNPQAASEDPMIASWLLWSSP
jgi:hypothetical protein